MRMPRPDSEVASKATAVLRPNDSAPLAVLADRAGHVVLKVEVLHLEADQLGPAGTRVEQLLGDGGGFMFTIGSAAISPSSSSQA